MKPTRLAVEYRRIRDLDRYSNIQEVLRQAMAVANEDLYLSFNSNRSK